MQHLRERLTWSELRLDCGLIDGGGVRQTVNHHHHVTKGGLVIAELVII